MRKIKFEYGFESKNGIIKKVYSLFEIPFIAEKCDVWNVLPIVYVRAFTGLHDKNGKEIYEGDIIQNVANDGRRLSIFQIRWQQSSCGFVKDREDGHTFTLEISKYFEVIGNIHQNPELL